MAQAIRHGGKIVIVLEEEEAEAYCCLYGNHITGSIEDSPRKELDCVYEALINVGVDAEKVVRINSGFSSFTGNVHLELAGYK